MANVKAALIFCAVFVGGLFVVFLGLAAFGYFFVGDDGTLSESDSSTIDAFESKQTPALWKRVNGDGYSYAVPHTWDRNPEKPDDRVETYVIDTEEQNGFYASVNTLAHPLGSMTLTELADNLRERAEANGATDMRVLSPFTVARYGSGDSSGTALPVFARMNYDGVSVDQYSTVIDLGSGDAAVVTIGTTPGDPDDLYEDIMGTFIVYD